MTLSGVWLPFCSFSRQWHNVLPQEPMLTAVIFTCTHMLCQGRLRAPCCHDSCGHALASVCCFALVV